MIDRNLLSYCPQTGVLRWKTPPHPRFQVGQRAGSLSSTGYVKIRVAGKDYPAHKVAWFLYHGVWPSEQVDHINRDKSDNRIKNLRLATASQNGANRGQQRNNTSGYKGVSWNKRAGKWQAMIKVRGKRKNLGSFDTPEEASKAYTEYAREIHGEFFSE